MRRHRVWSSTMPGKAYSVFVYSGRAFCDCPGHLTHGVECRHIREVLMSEVEQAVKLDEEMTRALVPVVPQSTAITMFPSPTDMQAMTFLSINFLGAAGLTLPKGIANAAVALTVIERGRELGVGPMTALRHITAINGTLEPDAQLMAGIVIAHSVARDGCPAEFVWLEVSSERAHVQLLRRGKLAIDCEYTLEDAIRAGRYIPEDQWPVRRKVRSWKKNSNGKNVPDEYEDGPAVSQRPDSYWYTNTALALAYNALKIACKLGAPDLINGIDFGISAAMFEASEYPEPGDWATVEALPATAPASYSGSNWRSDNAPPPAVSNRPQPKRITREDVQGELARQGVTASALGEYVGGTTTGAIEAWLNEHPGDTLMGLVGLAGMRVDVDTGEFREVPDGLGASDPDPFARIPADIA